MTTTYKIGEAAGLLNLKTYVLRFWETEFPDIAPLRTEKGQRLYTKEHLALLERIRYLLHERGLTIGGARKVLAEEKELGLAYDFTVPGALVKPAYPDVPPGFAPEDGTEDEEAAEDAPGGPVNASPEEGEDAPPILFPYGRAAAEQSPGRRPAQYNLPGLEQIIAMRAAALDSAPGPEYALTESEDAPPEPDDTGMLPLFAVAKAAFLVGKASGGASGELTAERGGGNFIHAGARSSEKRTAADADSDEATLFQAGGGPPSRSSLRDLASELESVAAILRQGESARDEPFPGPSSHGLATERP